MKYRRRRTRWLTVKELLRVEEDGTLSFGDFTLAQKTKLDNFEFEGDVYKVKTFSRDHKTREKWNVRL